MDRGCYNQSCNIRAGYLNGIVIVNEMAGLMKLVSVASVAKAEIEEVAPQLPTSGCPSWIDPLVPYTNIMNRYFVALYLFTAFLIKLFIVGHNGSIKLGPALHRLGIS